MSDTIAYHEAGHVVMALYLRAIVDHVTIEPEQDELPRRGGDVRVRWDRDRFSKRDILQNSIMVALAGPVAEMVYTGAPYHPGFVHEWAYDWQAAWDAAEAFAPNDRQRLQLLESTAAKLHRMFNNDEIWQAVAALADEIDAHQSLDSEQIIEAVEPWLEISSD